MRFGPVTAILAALSIVASAAFAANPPSPLTPPPAELADNSICLACHGNEGFSTKDAAGATRPLHVVGDKFGKSVHGKRSCVECHRDITEIPHKPGVDRKVSCVQCHDALWKAARQENRTEQFPRLGVVQNMINRYMGSIHARPSVEDQSRTNATCYNCHEAHYVFPKGSPEREEWRMNLPNICGSCHKPQLEQYKGSIHGKLVLEAHFAGAALCSDCHTTHDIGDPSTESVQLQITQNCGTCHKENLRTYQDTYHGQVNRLGYAYTAKCFDCHGSHGIQLVSDPSSKVHPDNRLQTCQKCHKDATPGFVTFEPHANTHDRERYPQMWYVSKFMIALLVGVFAFFWAHSGLWFYREYRERQARMSRTFVKTDELPREEPHGPYFRRWSRTWRVLHLVFALTVMTLVLTGMSVFYSNTGWASAVMNALGGPRVAAIIHRTAAVVFVSIFFGQLVYFLARIVRDPKGFDFFGPNSLIPRWQDLRDAQAMFRWFFGKGPRPSFDRWTYWEKFDYWAPFWGVAIIGASGLMLWGKTVTATYLPGWVFNVATIFHGEEAFLAAVFLFTVHFFNNHFRPDKFPLDILMFTGRLPLEEYRKEHAVEYERLVATGQLERYLVQAPSRPMTLGSKILGFTLIFFGLSLLVMVLTGFVTSLMT